MGPAPPRPHFRNQNMKGPTLNSAKEFPHFMLAPITVNVQLENKSLCKEKKEIEH